MMYLLCGLPGSGKSTYAASLGLPTISADSIREEWYGDAAVQGDGKAIFAEVYSRIDKAIASGIDFCVDNTSVDTRARANYLGRGTEVVAVFFNTSIEECKRRNNLRSRVVPEWVIDKMASRLTTPTTEEGFVEVRVI